MLAFSRYRTTLLPTDSVDADQVLGARTIRELSLVVMVFFVSVSGCSRLRLPAIDSTGQRIFNPLPATTSLAIPACSKTGKLKRCFTKLGDPLNCCKLPKPAFQDPATPPKCLTKAPGGIKQPLKKLIKPKSQACVPSAPCTEDCKTGPRAVLIGSECNQDRCHLPKRGKRGCILLTPQKIVAPVGGEVVLLSGICGDKGYLQVGEPLEWMLTPESVGTFIQVGDDDPGLMHTLAGIKKASKKDPSFAHGVTSTKRVKITRGNLNPNDDVQLEKGQTWITISSPSEGTSKVTVLAPESECWDQRKATATIYWVDASPQFPSAQIVPAGTPVTLNTRVTRSERTLPARGWKVRYEILQPNLASFAGTDGSAYVQSTVDEAGNATVQLIPTPGTSGTSEISMKVIRPGGDTDNMPTLTMFTGNTFVTWSAPQLGIRVGAPSVASFGVPFRAVANVTNPGDQAAQNVNVVLQVPQGVQVSSTDSFASNLPNAIVWEIGEIPAQTQLDLFADVTTESSFPLVFEARADGELYAADTVTVDVYRPSLAISITPRQERVEVGEAVTFDIDVRNTGDRPLTNVQLFAEGDTGMLHESNQKRVRKPKEDGPLQPGQTWQQAAVTFLPTDPGRRCIKVEVTADAGQQTSGESCVVVINKPLATPAVNVTLAGRSRMSVGSETLFRGVVVNTGRVPLDNVKVVMGYDPQLRPTGATDSNLSQPRSGQYLLEWVIPRLEPQTSETLEGKFQAVGVNPRSSITITVDSQQGAKASQRFDFEIVNSSVGPSAPAPSANVTPPPTLPPASAAPSIPAPRPTPSPTQIAPPPVTAPQPTAEPDALGLSLSGPVVAVFENQPIPYVLRVTNPSTQQDGNVSIKFNLPDGVRILRVNQTLSPELRDFVVDDSNPGQDKQVFLKDIGTMRPNESIRYDLVLISDRPQTFTITADAVSRGKSKGARSSVTTQVFPGQ